MKFKIPPIYLFKKYIVLFFIIQAEFVYSGDLENICEAEGKIGNHSPLFRNDYHSISVDFILVFFFSMHLCVGILFISLGNTAGNIAYTQL